MLTQEELKRQLSYDPGTGRFTWMIRKQKVAIGSQAGKTRPNGYREIRINLISYFEHRLAWLYMTGEWPAADIDHINRNPSDNRIENLREASRSENLRNVGPLASSSTRVRGVDFHKASSKFRARIRVSGKRIELGIFATLEEAKSAYQVAAKNLHGEFAVGLGE